MNQAVIAQLIPVLAPVLAAIAIGYAWAKLGRDFDVRFLANMIHNVGMPCLIFSTLTKVDVDPEIFVDMAWASAATHLAFLAIGALVLRAARLPLSIYLNGMVYPNAGNVGLLCACSPSANSDWRCPPPGSPSMRSWSRPWVYGWRRDGSP